VLALQLTSQKREARHEWGFAKNRSPLQEKTVSPEDAEALKAAKRSAKAACESLAQMPTIHRIVTH
jgi:hypothetical protein